ncbi:MAG: hypothetical protein KAS32_10245 [Candidatus Peribacteraceae bacterium]|nr:hypothetical protein [Candidatus Peribacteraceae bacterium]
MTDEKISLQDWLQFLQHGSEMMMNSLGSCVTPRMIAYSTLLIASLLTIIQTELWTAINVLAFVGITFAIIGIIITFIFWKRITEIIDMYETVQYDILISKIQTVEEIKAIISKK